MEEPKPLSWWVFKEPVRLHHYDETTNSMTTKTYRFISLWVGVKDDDDYNLYIDHTLGPLGKLYNSDECYEDSVKYFLSKRKPIDPKDYPKADNKGNYVFKKWRKYLHEQG